VFSVHFPARKNSTFLWNGRVPGCANQCLEDLGRSDSKAAPRRRTPWKPSASLLRQQVTKSLVLCFGTAFLSKLPPAARILGIHKMQSLRGLRHRATHPLTLNTYARGAGGGRHEFNQSRSFSWNSKVWALSRSRSSSVKLLLRACSC
jgi:hypothetical protein